MQWTIAYYAGDVEAFLLALPDGLLARYLRLADMILEFGPHLGMPHTRAMGDGLIELRVKGKEGIARLFFCAVFGRRVIMLHGFVKKSAKIPLKEIQTARFRLSQVKKS